MAVTVNGVAISEKAIGAEVQYHPAPSAEEAWQAATRALVVRELLLQAADRLGVISRADAGSGVRETAEETRIRLLVESEVAVPEPREDECRRYYESNPERFRSPDLFQAAHILFLAPPDDDETAREAKAQAERTIAALKESPSRFAALAAECSACPSGKQGGSLGQITRGQTVPELETFFYQLAEGELCPVPVRTRYGFHVVRLDHRTLGSPLPFDAVRERIAAYLADRSMRRALSQSVSLLVGAADITGIDLGGAGSPLVQ